MKRFIYILLLTLPLAAISQNMYNIAGLLENAPSGTSRFVGMGGSMGSLGGDVSVMGTNPAGTAVYRSSDLVISGNLDIVSNAAKTGLYKHGNDYYTAAFNNVGFVIACKMEKSSLKYLNFGIGYNKASTLSGNFKTINESGDFSQQYIIQNLYNGNQFDVNNVNSSMFQGFTNNWLAMLAVKAGLYNEKVDSFFMPSTYEYSGEQRGGVRDLNFNMSANICDRIYLGVTVGGHFVDYSRYSIYYEIDDLGDIYSVENKYHVRGKGVDFKLGAIFRPFKYSPFKVGMSVHTPILYQLTDISSANIVGNKNNAYCDTRGEDFYGDDLYVNYTFKTPWRFNASASYTFGSSIALNAEYEFSDAAKMSFVGNNDFCIAQNEEISYNMKPQHTVRVGAEFNVKNCALRLGYNYISATFSKMAYKNLDNATVTDTSTDFTNSYGKNIAAFGIGYTGKYFYIDAAYMMQVQKSDFYPFLDLYYDYENAAVKVNAVKHTVMATMGVRF